MRVPVGRASSFDELVDEALADFAEHALWTDDPEPTEDELLAELAEFQRGAGRSPRVDAIVAAVWRFWAGDWDDEEEG